MLFMEITCSDISNFDKECVKSRLLDSTKISDKLFPERRLKHSITWLKIKTFIQKEDKTDNIVILNKSDNTSKLS